MDVYAIIMLLLLGSILFALVYCQIAIWKDLAKWKKDSIANDLYWEEYNRRNREVWGD